MRHARFVVLAAAAVGLVVAGLPAGRRGAYKAIPSATVARDLDAYLARQAGLVGPPATGGEWQYRGRPTPFVWAAARPATTSPTAAAASTTKRACRIAAPISLKERKSPHSTTVRRDDSPGLQRPVNTSGTARLFWPYTSARTLSGCQVAQAFWFCRSISPIRAARS